MAFAELTYRESLRDISNLPERRPGAALPHGHPGLGCPRHLRGCQRAAELADLRGLRRGADLPCASALPRRALRRRNRGDGLCARFHDHRPPTVRLPVGAVPTHEGAAKLHTLLDLRGSIPTFLHITPGTVHNVSVLDELVPEAGAPSMLDCGYIDFAGCTASRRRRRDSLSAPGGTSAAGSATPLKRMARVGSSTIKPFSWSRPSRSTRTLTR